MKKFLALCCCMSLLFTGCSFNSVQEEEIVRLGAVLPLTGDFAPLGIEAQRGMEIALKELEQLDQNVQFEMIYEDEQSLNSTAAVQATNKLLHVDNIDAGLTLFIEQSHPIAPLFNEAKKPLLILWDANKKIQESGEYIFSNGFSTEIAGERMAEYVYYRLNKKNVAIIAHFDPWAEVIAEAFHTKFVQLGGKVALESFVSINDKDFRTTIQKIKESESEAVYFPLIPMESLDFLAQAKELKLDLPLLTGDALLPFVRDAAGELADGVYFTDIYTEDDQFLQKRYQELFSEKSNDIRTVAFGYDAVMKIVEAIESGDSDIHAGLFNIYGETRSADRIERVYMMNNGEAVELR